MVTLTEVKAMLFNGVPVTATTVEDALLTNLINQFTSLAESHCNRTFTEADHDELFEGNRFTEFLVVKNRPLVSVASIQYQPNDGLTIKRAGASELTVNSDGTTLRIKRTVAGTDTTTTYTLASSATLSALKTAIEADGFTVTIHCNPNRKATNIYRQGWNRLGEEIEVEIHEYSATNYTITEKGVITLERSSIAEFWSDLMPSDGPQPKFGNYWRVRYRGGYSATPNDLKYTAILWIINEFWLVRNNRPHIAGFDSGTLQMLKPYRNLRL